MAITALEYYFNCHASDGVCDVCGKSAPVMADVTTLQCKCFSCLVAENMERKKQRERIPLDLEDFCR